MFSSFAFAQNMSVESFRCLETDLSASYAKVEDINNQICALLKVSLPISGVEFTGTGLESYEQRTGEYWVFVSPGMKFITIKHRDFHPIRNYAFPQRIESARTYEMVVKVDAIPQPIDSASMMSAMEQKLLEMEQRLGELISNQNAQQAPTPQPNQVIPPSQPLIKNNPSQFKLLKTLNCKGVQTISYSPDGRKFAAGRRDKIIEIRDANTYKCLKKLYVGCPVYNLAYSPDGTKIASADNEIIEIWDVNTGNCLKTWRADMGYCASFAWSPDGKRIVSTTNNEAVNIWDVNTGRLLRKLQLKNTVEELLFSPDGSNIVIIASDIIKLDANTFELLHINDEQYISTNGCGSYSPDGSKITAGNYTDEIKIWDANTLRCIQTLKGHSSSYEKKKPIDVGFVFYSPDGTKIMSSIRDCNIKIWDANKGECLQTLVDHTEYVISGSWSPDGRKFVSASYDETIKIWGCE